MRSLASYGFVLAVALLEGEPELIGFSSEPDKKFAIRSVKLFSGTAA
jgi:hypothetical protein